jgi:hypothetical protein
MSAFRLGSSDAEWLLWVGRRLTTVRPQHPEAVIEFYLAELLTFANLGLGRELPLEGGRFQVIRLASLRW